MITRTKKEYRIAQGIGGALDTACIAIIIGTKAMNPVAKVFLIAMYGIRLVMRIILAKELPEISIK